MNTYKKILALMLCGLLTLTLLAGCSPGGGAASSGSEAVVMIEDNDDVPLLNTPGISVLTPSADGIKVYKNTKVYMDASNISQGYVMVKYLGKNSKIKIQIKRSGSAVTYTYDINKRDAFEVFPFSEGNGSYTIKVFENISGTKYSQAFSKTMTVKLANQFLPFLYPNQYVDFTADSDVVKKAQELTTAAAVDLDKVEKIYDYVVGTFTYDREKAATVKSGYLPDTDYILLIKKGICFDYAAVMSAMLRSQNIPSKLVVGYTGNAYHAWINVYIKGEGWVDAMIYFDGTKWQIMDPTFASTAGKSEAIIKYISNPENYKAKYTY